MPNFSKGKYSQSISDRSGQAFPFQQMVKEWNGSLVHTSEFEPKSPQLDPKHHKADPQALQDTRAQDFSLISGGDGEATANLTLPGEFAFESSGMIPNNPSAQNSARQFGIYTGKVTVVIS
jgi:hypothetical protein